MSGGPFRNQAELQIPCRNLFFVYTVYIHTFQNLTH